jgi:catechol 2,3-dioxygenase-like lactoylglutathione lyase family enzyme
MLKLRRAHHVAVICSDDERSRRFYIDILGLEVVREVHRRERDSYKLDLRLPDGTQIELFSFPDPPKRPSYPEACGPRHLAFEVADVDEAARLRRDTRLDRTERAVGPWLAPLRRLVAEQEVALILGHAKVWRHRTVFDGDSGVDVVGLKLM